MLVVAFNYLLRTIIVSLIEWIGKKTYSSQMNTILKYLFLSQFINTALVLLSVYSNLENSHVPILRNHANGPYPDFTMEWYFKVGAMYS